MRIFIWDCLKRRKIARNLKKACGLKAFTRFSLETIAHFRQQSLFQRTAMESSLYHHSLRENGFSKILTTIPLSSVCPTRFDEYEARNIALERCTALKHFDALRVMPAGHRLLFKISLRIACFSSCSYVLILYFQTDG